MVVGCRVNNASRLEQMVDISTAPLIKYVCFDVKFDIFL